MSKKADCPGALVPISIRAVTIGVLADSWERRQAVCGRNLWMDRHSEGVTNMADGPIFAP